MIVRNEKQAGRKPTMALEFEQLECRDVLSGFCGSVSAVLGASWCRDSFTGSLGPAQLTQKYSQAGMPAGLCVGLGSGVAAGWARSGSLAVCANPNGTLTLEGSVGGGVGAGVRGAFHGSLEYEQDLVIHTWHLGGWAQAVTRYFGNY